MTPRQQLDAILARAIVARKGMLGAQLQFRLLYREAERIRDTTRDDSLAVDAAHVAQLMEAVDATLTYLRRYRLEL